MANPEKAAAIKVYLATLDKAYVWTATHPTAWATAWGKAAGLPTSIMDVAAKTDATTPVAITSATVSSEQGLVDQFFAAGLMLTGALATAILLKRGLVHTHTTAHSESEALEDVPAIIG